MKLRHLLFSISALALPAKAANLTWDADTATTGVQDAAGTWNTSNTNWWNGTANQSFTSGDNVTFGTPASGAAISVDAGGVNVGNLTFNTTGASSYQFTGGSITGGALVKSGSSGLRFDNANSFTSVTINGGPNSATDGAIRLGNANALGTAAITFANTSTMTGLYFLTGFGTSTTLSNNITFVSGAVQTNLSATAGISQVVTLSGVLSGGNAGATIFLNNSASGGVAKFKVTNASNTVLGTWKLNRGALEFTSDAALGNAANDITLDVTSTNAGTGLTFGANNIALNSGRSVSLVSQTIVDTGAFTGSSIQGQITGSGNIVRRGTTSLVPANNTNSHSGGWTIATAPATGASQGSLHLTSASLNGSNVFSGLGTGTITATSAGTILSAAVSGTASNNIVLPNTATRHDFVAANGTELTLSGVISGGGASLPTFFVNTDTIGGSTGLVKLTGTNTFTGKVQINRGGLAITSDAALGNSANTVLLDIGTTTQIGIRFDSAMSSARSIELGGGKQVLNTNGNNVTLSGVVSGTGELHKLGTGTLTLSNANTYSGLTNVTAGTLAVTGTLGSGTYAGNVSIASGTTLDMASSYSQTLSGAISGSGSLTKSGSGSLTLSGNSSSFAGTTTVSAGTLLVTGQLGGNASTSGTLAGGGTIGGNLGFLSGSFFDITNALLGDALSVGGTVTFASGFGIDNLTGVTWGSVSNGTYTLIDTTGTDFSLAGLDNFGSGNAYDLGGGRSAYFKQGSLQLVVVPEPASALLGGVGLVLLLRRRCR